MSDSTERVDGTRPYEERDVAFRPILLVAVFLALLSGSTIGLMYALNRSLAARETRESPPPNPLAESYAPRTPPSPRLQENPRLDLEALHARERGLLESYAWIDRAAGRVRIPIARALALMVEEARR
jgi:hypothetical protein